MSLGLLISNTAQSQQSAMLLSMLGMMVPTMLFTGFMFPLENMPVPLQIFANIFPSKWYYIIIKSIMIKGLGFSAIWKETLILAITTCFLLFVSIKKFKIRLAWTNIPLHWKKHVIHGFTKKLSNLFHISKKVVFLHSSWRGKSIICILLIYCSKNRARHRDCSVIGSSVRLTNTSEDDSLTRVRTTH